MLLLLPCILAYASVSRLGRSLTFFQDGFITVELAGFTLEMEHFADLPLIAGIYLLVSLLRRQVPAWPLIWLGTAGTLSILYKLTYIAFLVVATFCMPTLSRTRAENSRAVLPAIGVH